MKKLITKTLVSIFFAAMLISLILNFFLQIFLNIHDFRKTAADNFWQIEQIVEEKEQELAKVKEDFAENCIVRARAAAYIAQHYPAVIEDMEECKLVASLLQVDELHFFTTDGEIYAGTHPEYYGYNFSSGEQMHFFAPLLEDHSLELCQDITPNTAEQKLMQYAAVWRKDGKGIVQVGLEPERVLKAIEGNDVSEIFSMLSTDASCVFYAVDGNSQKILGSTDKGKVGKNAADLGLPAEIFSKKSSWDCVNIDGEKQYYAAEKEGSLLLVKTCPTDELHKNIPGNTLLLCIYFVLLFMILMFTLYLFLERRIIRSIVNINKKLKAIEQGNRDTVLSEDSTAEFAELCRYINTMVDSLLNFTKKISKALEMSEVPIAICEYVPGTNRFTATSRMKDILMLTDKEVEELTQNPQYFEKKIQRLCRKEACLEGNIYCLDSEEERYIRVESFMYNNSRMTIFIDVTADIMEKQRIAKERDTDLLTGLYNRRAFYHRVETLFQQPQQLKNALMVMIDLDNLKTVNDVYGHACGDRYLTAFAEILYSYNTENKIAARMGGDEFTLFAYGFEDKEEIRKIIEELLAFRGSYKVYMEKSDAIALEFSMGWAFYPEEEAEYQALIKLADSRMYEDKKLRKGSK